MEPQSTFLSLDLQKKAHAGEVRFSQQARRSGGAKPLPLCASCRALDRNSSSRTSPPQDGALDLAQKFPARLYKTPPSPLEVPLQAPPLSCLILPVQAS